MPNILIADDEFFIRQLIRETLSIDPTLSFLEVEDGTAAIASARETCPDLIILDIIMPKMDGLQVCRLLKSDPTLCMVPIIVMTAYIYSGYEEASHEAGADGFLKKPFEEADLLAVVRRALPGSIQ